MALNNIPKLADVNSSASLDLSVQDAAIGIPITNGQGVLGVDVIGLTGSGATVVCEMRVGNSWRASNMLVSGTGGAFAQSITADAQFRSSAAAKWAARIRVSVPGVGVATVSWSLSTNSSVIQLTAPLPPGTNQIGTIAVSNFPATQPVSGSVGVNNFPMAFGATQSGPWSVGVLSLPTLPTGTNAIGSVSVSNLPATQAVSGTFWQATQPVSAAGLPASLGAKASAASMSVVVASDQAPLPIVRRAVGTIATGQKSVAQAATLVIPANATRYNAVLTTSTSGAFYVGGPSVSPTTGLYIASGGYYTHEATTALYVYAASGTMTFTYMDESA